MSQEIIVAGIGLVVTALTGGTALGVNRLLNLADELKKESKEHGEAIAVMQATMPNGEWREIKNSLSSVHGTVREVQTEVSEIKGNLSDLKIDFGEHAATEKDRMIEAIESTCAKFKKLPITKKSLSAAKRKLK